MPQDSGMEVQGVPFIFAANHMVEQFDCRVRPDMSVRRPLYDSEPGDHAIIECVYKYYKLSTASLSWFLGLVPCGPLINKLKQLKRA